MLYVKVFLFFATVLFSLTSLYGSIKSTMGYFCFPERQIVLLNETFNCPFNLTKTENLNDIKIVLKSNRLASMANCSCGVLGNTTNLCFEITKEVFVKQCGMDDKMKDASVFLLYAIVGLFSVTLLLINLSFRNRMFLRWFKTVLKTFGFDLANEIKFCNEITNEPTVIDEGENYIRFVGSVMPTDIPVEFYNGPTLNDYSFRDIKVVVTDQSVIYSENGVGLTFNMELEQLHKVKRYLHLIHQNPRFVCVDYTSRHHIKMKELLVGLASGSGTILMFRCSKRMVVLDSANLTITGEINDLLEIGIKKILLSTELSWGIILRLIKHNTLFFGELKISALMAVLAKRTSYFNRPANVRNCQWRLYTSDCKHLLKDTKAEHFWVQKKMKPSRNVGLSADFEDVSNIFKPKSTDCTLTFKMPLPDECQLIEECISQAEQQQKAVLIKAAEKVSDDLVMIQEDLKLDNVDTSLVDAISDLKKSKTIEESTESFNKLASTYKDKLLTMSQLITSIKIESKKMKKADHEKLVRQANCDFRLHSKSVLSKLVKYKKLCNLEHLSMAEFNGDMIPEWVPPKEPLRNVSKYSRAALSSKELLIESENYFGLLATLNDDEYMEDLTTKIRNNPPLVEERKKASNISYQVGSSNVEKLLLNCKKLSVLKKSRPKTKSRKSRNRNRENSKTTIIRSVLEPLKTAPNIVDTVESAIKWLNDLKSKKPYLDPSRNINNNLIKNLCGRFLNGYNKQKPFWNINYYVHNAFQKNFKGRSLKCEMSDPLRRFISSFE